MKLYLAGLYTGNFNIVGGRIYRRCTDVEKAARHNVLYHLESYHYINKASYVEKIRRDGKKVFLDSGAFSAFTKGVKVDLPKYCRWIKSHIDIIDCASVLDSIGDAQGTYANQIAMEKLGVTPLPCYHYGEDPKYLEYYIANYEYITLGGMVPISTPKLHIWLDDIFDKYLVDGAGRPKVKIHGFGLTAIPLMKKYPWYSVDSSSWVQAAANGRVWHPVHGDIYLSSNHPLRKKEGFHLSNMPQPQQDFLYDLLETQLGYEVDRLQNNYIARWAFNCWSFTEINNILYEADPKFKRVVEGIF